MQRNLRKKNIMGLNAVLVLIIGLALLVACGGQTTTAPTSAAPTPYSRNGPNSTPVSATRRI